MGVAIAVLWVLAVPLVGLMGLAIAGMVRRPALARSRRSPSVSVVVPARNEEASLPYTLDALAAQRYPGPLEFVIVDDRSTDRTRDVIEAYRARDPRFRPCRVAEAGRRLSPKVHAVDRGIRASRHEIVVTTDADCRFGPDWIAALVSYFDDDVAMVSGYVEAASATAPGGVVQRLDAVDWLVLMLVSRSLTRFGWSLASSANNQAYRRSAFDAVQGFGASGRAPSGDEDLFAQRIGRLPGCRIAFAEHPDARVRTEPAASLPALLRQRRRWVSRYHHPIHYHPGFLAGIVLLGAHSTVLTLALLALPAAPHAAPWVLGPWAVVACVQALGLWIGTGQIGRRDLWGWPVAAWALAHPAFIATVSVWSLVRPGDWGSGSPGYRRRFVRRRLREVRRRLRTVLGGT